MGDRWTQPDELVAELGKGVYAQARLRKKPKNHTKGRGVGRKSIEKIDRLNKEKRRGLLQPKSYQPKREAHAIWDDVTCPLETI